MTDVDPFARDDAAYVLGALPPAERAAFEAHLIGCAACSARVDELTDMPRLLSGVTAEEVTAHLDATEPPPDTLLPGLLRAASARRRRTRALVTALGTVAAACVIALVMSLWPGSPTPSPQPKQAAQFVALVSEPISANAVLTAKKWGTEIDLKCVYAANVGDHPVPYKMWAYTKDNHRYPAGGWKQLPEVTYVGGTSLTIDQIARIDIVLPNGKAILRLNR